ncbi:hypothetical protein CLF_107258 [Clonorchis sinensis]|uniref:Uncharacterized protein n=1 Tax=Clonorchis sinensis TaxID=79923 RepID=G7YGF9_CLOSI|nr:hypothetical protein CLF_107258 [Clonorchis sinensis]
MLCNPSYQDCIRRPTCLLWRTDFHLTDGLSNRKNTPHPTCKVSFGRPAAEKSFPEVASHAKGIFTERLYSSI